MNKWCNSVVCSTLLSSVHEMIKILQNQSKIEFLCRTFGGLLRSLATYFNWVKVTFVRTQYMGNLQLLWTIIFLRQYSRDSLKPVVSFGCFTELLVFFDLLMPCRKAKKICKKVGLNAKWCCNLTSRLLHNLIWFKVTFACTIYIGNLQWLWAYNHTVFKWP